MPNHAAGQLPFAWPYIGTPGASLFTFHIAAPCCINCGISVELVDVAIPGSDYGSESVLVTHSGLSGPVIRVSPRGVRENYMIATTSFRPRELAATVER